MAIMMLFHKRVMQYIYKLRVVKGTISLLILLMYSCCILLNITWLVMVIFSLPYTICTDTSMTTSLMVLLIRG